MAGLAGISHRLRAGAPKAGKTSDCGFPSQEAFVIFADPHLPAVVGLLLSVPRNAGMFEIYHKSPCTPEVGGAS